MTTVVDPAGTPVPVYNRSGTTIVSLTAAGTVSGGPSLATPIVTYSGTTIVLVTVPDGSNVGVVLPTDVQIGDLVEIYNAGGVSAPADVIVWVPSGETLFVGSGGSATSEHQYRKVSSTAWFSIGG